MRTITKTVYFYSELSEKAKEKAREWWLNLEDYSDCWEDIKEDAQNIGLEILELSEQTYKNKGCFIVSAVDCAKKIIKEHGETCDTYQMAKNFLADYEKTLYTELVKTDFLRGLLIDYERMHRKDIEYRQSEEYISETMEANEYEFYENGERV